MVLSPRLPLHLVNLEPEDIVFYESFDCFVYLDEITIFNKLCLGYSDYDLVELESAEGSVCIVNHINELNIGCNKKSVDDTHREFFVNQSPLIRRKFSEVKILTWSQTLEKFIQEIVG